MTSTVEVPDFFMIPVCHRCGGLITGIFGRCTLSCIKCNVTFQESLN